MSKDKLHIDDLFKQLKNYEHLDDGQSFTEIQQKQMDAAWQAQFEDYAHSDSDIPAFETLAMPKSDQEAKPGKAMWGTILLSGILAITLMVSSAMSSDHFGHTISHSNQKVIKAKPLQTSSIESSQSQMQVKSNQRGILADDPLKTEASSNKRPTTPDRPKTIQSKSSFSSSDNEIKKNTHTWNKSLVNASSLSTNEVSQNAFNNISKNDSKSASLNDVQSTNELVIDAFIVQINSLPRGIHWNKQKTLSLGPQNELKTGNKRFAPLKKLVYFNGGTNALSSNPSLPNTLGQNGSIGLHLNLGLQKGRLQAQTGWERNTFNYETTLQTIQIYDSIPHIGINGDTIGWFKRNLRDTTLGANLRSGITVNTIPLHLSFKALQIQKFSVTLGGGLNINLLNSNTLWLNDDISGYTVNAANNGSNILKKATLGVNLHGQIGYRINPLNEVYARLQVVESGNVLNSTSNSLRISGFQVNLGLKYYLGAL